MTLFYKCLLKIPPISYDPLQHTCRSPGFPMINVAAGDQLGTLPFFSFFRISPFRRIPRSVIAGKESLKHSAKSAFGKGRDPSRFKELPAGVIKSPPPLSWDVKHL